MLLCPFHHRTVHEGGWQVEMDERGVPRFFNPLQGGTPDLNWALDWFARKDGDDLSVGSGARPAATEVATRSDGG